MAHTVTMNLRYAIQDNLDAVRANSVTYLSPTSASFDSLVKNYIVSERGGTVGGLVFAGTKLIGASFDTTASPYLIAMTQDEPSNRFLIPLTALTWGDIDAAYSLSKDKVPPAAFGKAPQVAFPPLLVLQLTLDNLDLLGPLSAGTVMISNLGKARLPIVRLEMIG
jgi:hypothetical protein